MTAYKDPDVNVTLKPYEQRLIVQGMADLRNRLIVADKPTEDVDDILLKVIDAAPVRRRRTERGER